MTLELKEATFLRLGLNAKTKGGRGRFCRDRESTCKKMIFFKNPHWKCKRNVGKSGKNSEATRSSRVELERKAIRTERKCETKSVEIFLDRCQPREVKPWTSFTLVTNESLPREMKRVNGAVFRIWKATLSSKRNQGIIFLEEKEGEPLWTFVKRPWRNRSLALGRKIGTRRGEFFGGKPTKMGKIGGCNGNEKAKERIKKEFKHKKVKYFEGIGDTSRS